MEKTIWSCTLEEDLASLVDMIAGGVDIDSTNDLGETSLHLASSRGLERAAKILLGAGANVHLRDLESGWTPLHRSLYFGHVRISLLLLQAGAVLDCERDKTASKLHLARSRSRSESLGSASNHPGSANTNSSADRRRLRFESLFDSDGNSPLDVLSLELRPQLKVAREMGVGGDVYSFGKADFFLGYDSFEKADVIQPRRIEALANLRVVRVAASKAHSAAVTLGGRLLTWGHGRGGRLGHGNEDVCMLPTVVEGLANETVTDVAASETHTVASTADGELYTWGRDRFGQLGHGPGSSGRLVPKRVEGLRRVFVVGVAAGNEHTAVATRSGACYTWGRNNHGQLGLEGVNQICVPRAVSYLASSASRGAGGMGRHAIKVSAAARSTVVVTRGVDKGSGLRPVNEVYQWGHGSHVPSRVKFDGVKDGKDGGSSSRWQTHDARVSITDVAAAKCHNLALSSAGQVFTWGYGADNLGLDPRETRTARGPQLVAAMLPENYGGNAVYISASDHHSCVVTDAGDLYTWGAAGEAGGALGLGKKRWQPFAKRVPGLKKVSSVAAAPDHTIVLLQASCPSLPHGAVFADSGAQAQGLEADDGVAFSASGQDEEKIEDEEDILKDSDSEHDGELEDKNRKEGHAHASLRDLYTTDANGMPEPLTLKQHCEVVLAREVDLSNASSLLAYADALDAPGLVEYCTEFVRSNLDGVLVVGRESDRRHLLETPGVLASSPLILSGSSNTTASTNLKPVPEAAHPDDVTAFRGYKEDEGINREAMERALARAEMRAKLPSTEVSGKAVRSLKKKIARIIELESMRDSGKQLSPEQVSKVDQKSRMEAELSSFESQLQRAKLLQAARAQRLRAAAKATAAQPTQDIAEESKESLSAKQTLFPEETHETDDGREPTTHDEVSKVERRWTPQLDLSTPQLDLSRCQAMNRRPFKCEACGVECANSNMYADHLRGKRHSRKYDLVETILQHHRTSLTRTQTSGRATIARLERQLHDAAQETMTERTSQALTESASAKSASRNLIAQDSAPPDSTVRDSPTTSQASSPARTWADVSVQDSITGGSVAVPAVSTIATFPTDLGSHDGGQGRRASYPGDKSGKPIETRRVSNQLPCGSDLGTMRQVLEMQQRVATAMIGSARKQEPTLAEAQAMTSLRSTASAAVASREVATQRSSLPAEATTAPTGYSLVDFMTVPGTKKPSRHKEKCPEKSGKTERIWGAEGDESAGASTVTGRGFESPKSKAGVVEEPVQTKKSLHEIIQEEEQEKKEREEYGSSVWFVSRKPRSTSFESIVQQQRREELIAEEERKREAENRMEEEILRAVLEISKQQAQPSHHNQDSASRGRGSRNRKEKGRSRRGPKPEYRAESMGGAALPETPRTLTVGKEAVLGTKEEAELTRGSRSSRGGRSRRARGPQGHSHSGASKRSTQQGGER